jgi:hypothetical protein
LSIDKGHTKTRYERFGLPVPKWANPSLIRTFGEAGVVRRGKDGKLGDRGLPMVFVGYSDNHSWDCYRMWNPKTNKITETRDVIWLHRMYYQVDVDDETAMVPEIHMELNSIPAEIIEELKRTNISGKREPGGVDPVLDESEVENEYNELVEEPKDEPATKEVKSESSETREGENDVDSVLTEVSDDREEAEENVVRTRI